MRIRPFSVQKKAPGELGSIDSNATSTLITSTSHEVVYIVNELMQLYTNLNCVKPRARSDQAIFRVIMSVAFVTIITAGCGGGEELWAPSLHDAPPPSAPLPKAARQTVPFSQPMRQSFQGARPSGDPYVALDSILEKMSIGNIAFNSPQSMNIEDTGTIKLKLGLGTEISDLKKLIESEGIKEGFKIKVAERMEARLSGQNFWITAITPEVQAVSRNEITTWSWEVKPKVKGKQYLYLTLTALIGINGSPTPRTLRTFSKAVNVEVTQGQQLGSFLGQNWQWLWATFLIPVAGWIWKIKKE